MSHTNESMAHDWAHQRTDYKSHGNLIIDGDTIYSYGRHFPMARHIDGIVLYTSETYSVTTSSHLSDVRYASNHIRSFTVPYVMASDKPTHRKNYKYLLEQSDESLKKASTARSRKEYLQNEALNYIAQANKYSKFFKLGYKAKVVELLNMDEIRAKVKKQQAAQLKKRKAAAAKLAKENAAKIQIWRDGQNVSLPFNLPVFLRVKDGLVETSKRVNFPVEHAPLAWKVIRRCVDRKKAWKANGHTIKLGHYQVTSISSTGTLVAGCHTVPFSESQYIANLLNLENFK